MGTRAASAALLAIGLLWPAPLRAESRGPAPRSSGKDDTCFDHHELGQELRQRGKLLQSRTEFLACAASECPRVVQRDCARWASEVAAELPSVVFRVSFEGKARPDASVSIDGAVQARAQSEPVLLEPGVHRYRVYLTGASTFESELELRAGEPARQIVLALHAPTPEGPRPVPALSWVLGGIGVASTASFIGFGLSSRSLEHELEHRCSPLCTEEQIDRVQRRSVIANVSLGVALTSLVSAAALYFLSPPREPEEPDQPALQVGVVPLGGSGALANIELRAF